MLADIESGIPPVSRSHPDIWDVIAWHLQHRAVGQITITKVKAHVNWQTLETGQPQQIAFFNNAVDLEAKKAVAADCFSEWQEFAKLFGRKKAMETEVRQFHDLLCEIHDRSFRIKPREGVVAAKPCFEALWNMNMQGVARTMQAPDILDVQNCPFGLKFAGRVLQWWNKLRWYDGPPVLVIELCFDYCIET